MYTSDTPIASIPRIRIYATTTGYDGSTIERIIPTARQMVRPDYITKTIAPAVPFNVLTDVFGANAAAFKMNRRYLLVTNLSITCTSSGGGTVVRTVPVNFRPDNRAQILKEFQFLASDNKTITATFQGHVTWDNGQIFYNVVINDDGGTSDTDVTVDAASFIFRFVPVSSMMGRTKVMPKIETTDVTIDLNEDFLIDLTQEDIQDQLDSPV